MKKTFCHPNTKFFQEVLVTLFFYTDVGPETSSYNLSSSLIGDVSICSYGPDLDRRICHGHELMGTNRQGSSDLTEEHCSVELYADQHGDI
jgi:hypothetical protein